MPFDFNGNLIQVIMFDDEPWFVATNVAKVLGYRNAPDATRMLRAKEPRTHSVRTNAGLRESTIISEQGLYRLVMRSERQEAEAFQDWVTGEVLPSIRKTGAYVVGQPQALDPLDLLQGMIDTMRTQRHELMELRERHADLDERTAALEDRTEILEASHERVAAVGYAAMRGLRADVMYLNRLGRAAAVIARRDGIPVERVHSTIWGQVNAWPIEVWDEALEQVGR
jgi:prophage antirepressor-like protein